MRINNASFHDDTGGGGVDLRIIESQLSLPGNNVQ